MELNILSDSQWESRVDVVSKELSSSRYREIFASRNYGSGLSALIIILMCRNPELRFKQRIRFSKSDRTLYMDIMLDLNRMREATPESRRQIVIEKLATEVPSITTQRQIPEFDEKRFIADFREWLEHIR
jgi:hypothetical protein